ncbi:exodeoxyribonuclease III [Cerasicoccus fimbriatus]|uniref:exodeoxyribonuclease III n=1 Tax=Cerasicoccus fimbriatus TaxID=3014554 RepID=UPI0022B58081|nr:exodeoxyribonuclease III [Cerasicoccus sp. TK19100]
MSNTIEIISWNVNGLRAVLKKGFLDFVEQQQPDIICLQEIKASEHQIPKLEMPFAQQCYHSADKAGYSGTATFSKFPILNNTTGLPEHPAEGRILTTEHESFYLINVYVPNSQDELRRLPYRTMEFDPDFRAYIQELDAKKPVIVCGDFNVAHEEIDIARPKANRRTAGFTDEEREQFTQHLGIGLVDIFREQHPDEPDHYTWWSYRGGARGRNVGWRIDYFLVSERLVPKVKKTEILSSVMGSDHCPISMTLEV